MLRLSRVMERARNTTGAAQSGRDERNLRRSSIIGRDRNRFKLVEII